MWIDVILLLLIYNCVILIFTMSLHALYLCCCNPRNCPAMEQIKDFILPYVFVFLMLSHGSATTTDDNHWGSWMIFKYDDIPVILTATT